MNKQSASSPRLMLAALAATLLGSCDVVDMRVQVEKICIVAPSETFAGASSSATPFPFPLGASTPVRMNFDRPLTQVPGAAAGLDLDTRFEEVTIRSTNDLTFIRTVRITVEPGTPKSTLPALLIGELVRDPSATAATKELKIRSGLQVNVFKYLIGEPARLRFTVTGALPKEPFKADVEACIFVQGQFTL
jgi:hypothetical protein